MLNNSKAGGNKGSSGSPNNNNKKKPAKKDAGKNDPHGDNGRSLSKAEKQIQELERQLKNAKGNKSKEILKKIQNIRKIAQKNGRGETHHRK